MGQPSMAIYVNELMRDYDVTTIIRVGSCGALTENVALRDLVIASGACTDSSMNRITFEGLDYAPVADFGLLRRAYDAATARAESAACARGPDLLQRLVLRLASRTRLADGRLRVLAVEMEASALYTLAAKHGARALAVCTVSDHIVTGEETTAQERQETFGAMVEVALSAAFAR
jgi:purine-nucleoside phosphorylase